AGRPRRAPVDRHVGRPRARQQLGRRDPRGRPAPGPVPAPARRRLPGLLGAHAVAAHVAPQRDRPAALPPDRLRRPCRVQRPGHAPVPLRPGLRRHRRHRLRGAPGPVAHDHGRRAGGLAARRPRGLPGALERPGPAGLLRPARLRGRAGRVVQHGRLGRLRRLPRADPPRRRRAPRGQPGRAHGGRAPALGERPQGRLLRSGVPDGGVGAGLHVDHLQRRRDRGAHAVQPASAGREPAHQVQLQPARLRALRGQPGGVAGRLPRPALRQAARRGDQHRPVLHDRGRQPRPAAREL
ncbi:MAG: Phosphodiesterase/alkaline phosphatase D, partial [uncultured Thermoleophilia bacterium]